MLCLLYRNIEKEYEHIRETNILLSRENNPQIICCTIKVRNNSMLFVKDISNHEMNVNEKNSFANNYSSLSLNFNFRFIFFLFKMFGIDVRKDSTSRLLTEDQNAVKQHFFSTQGCIRSFVLLLICIRFAIQILWIIVLPNKRIEFSRFCLYLLAVVMYVSIKKGRHVLLQTAEDLNKIIKELPTSRLAGQLFPVIAILIEIALNIYRLSLNLIENDKTELQKTLIHWNEFLMPLKLNPLFYDKFFMAFDFIYYYVSSVFIFLFVISYGIICAYLRIVFKYLLDILNRKNLSRDVNNYFNIYVDVSNCLCQFDRFFSFPAFVSVLNYMLKVFWNGYRLAFDKNISGSYYLHILCNCTFCFFLLLFMMISASFVNEAAHDLKNNLQLLRYDVPKHQKEVISKKY